MKEIMNLTDNFDRLFPEKSDNKSNGIEYFNGAGNSRIICFQPNEDWCIALPYHHINSHELDLRESEIFLDFGNYKVKMRGHNMEKLFKHLLVQSISYISVAHNRFAALKNKENSYVTTMKIESINN